MTVRGCGSTSISSIPAADSAVAKARPTKSASEPVPGNMTARGACRAEVGGVRAVTGTILPRWRAQRVYMGR